MHIPTVVATLAGEAKCYQDEADKMAFRIAAGETEYAAQYAAHRQGCQTTADVLRALAKALECGTDERVINKLKARDG